MPFPVIILIALMAAAPLLAVAGMAGTPLLLIAGLSIATALVAIAARQADANHLIAALRGIRCLLALPLIVILAQLVPVPLSLAHPVWTIINDATDGLGYGHVSVDLGRTIAVLVVALALMAATACSIVIARDRGRAELLLIAAGAITSLVALWTIARLLLPALIGAVPPDNLAVQFASLGLVLNAAVILLAFERRETRKQQAMHYLPIELGGALAVLINIACLIMTANASQAIAVGIGVAVLLLLMTIRRLNLSSGTVVGLCAAALIGIGMLAAWLFGVDPTASGLLRFVRPPDAETLAVLQRVLSDGRWLGSGAGTIDVLARIYQTGEAPTALIAPTDVIQLSVETGWIGLSVFLLVALGLCAKLFRGALARGRDWFFPAVAAAAVVVTLFGSFVGAGLLAPSIALITAIIIGVGLSQAFSQSGR